MVHNPANVNQTYSFGFVMPDKALVSDVSVVRANNGVFEEENHFSENNSNFKKSFVNASNYMSLLNSAIQEEDDVKSQDLIADR